MPTIDFPTSTQPGINTTENGGRLINVFAEKAPDGSRSKALFRSAPGLRPEFVAGVADYRGSVNVNEVLYIANGSTIYSVVKSGSSYTITGLVGTLEGSGIVMMERNMRSPVPQVLVLHSDGMSQVDISAGTVSNFSDSDLPEPNSLAFLDSYFAFTIANGQLIVSGQNDITISGLDEAVAEASPDGLVRGITVGRDYLAMGSNTIEFWSDAGNPTGYPFSRGTVLQLGLFGSRAVAGMERGFPGNVCFVGNDRRVYELSGYTPSPISTPYIESLLQAVDDPADLDASVYSIGGHSCFVLTGPTWTLVYDQSTGGGWHERMSIGTPRWRAQGGVNVFNTWLAFERGGNQVYVIDPTCRRENTDQLVCEWRSIQDHRFPGRFTVKRASFDFLTGIGIDRGVDPIETDPHVEISWSDDGGVTFCTGTMRSLGRQGTVARIDRRNCGMTRQLGRQWRLVVADPVPVTLMGAAMDIEVRLP